MDSLNEQEMDDIQLFHIRVDIRHNNNITGEAKHFFLSSVLAIQLVIRH